MDERARLMSAGRRPPRTRRGARRAVAELEEKQALQREFFANAAASIAAQLPKQSIWGATEAAGAARARRAEVGRAYSQRKGAAVPWRIAQTVQS